MYLVSQTATYLDFLYSFYVIFLFKNSKITCAFKWKKMISDISTVKISFPRRLYIRFPVVNRYIRWGLLHHVLFQTAVKYKLSENFPWLWNVKRFQFEKKLLFTYSDFSVRVSGPFRSWLSKFPLLCFSSKQIWLLAIPLLSLFRYPFISWMCYVYSGQFSPTYNPLEIWLTIESFPFIFRQILIFNTQSWLLAHSIYPTSIHYALGGGCQVYGSVALPLFLEVLRAKSQHP